MKIGIDGNEVLHGERAIRRYAVNLIRSIASLSSPHQYNILYFRFQRPAHPPLDLGTSRNFENRFIFFPGQWILKSWQRFGLPKISYLLGNMDLFHALGAYVPPRGKIPTIVTVHGMHHARIRELLDPSYLSLYEIFMKHCIDDADYFITVSETVKEDFIKYYAIPETRVRAIPLGVSHEFRPQDRNQALGKLRSRFGIDRPYILYVGGIQRHKNVQGILQAFYDLKQRYKEPLMLILAGDRPAGSQEILDLVPKLGLEGDVFVTGYLQQETHDLENLYAAAEIFVFPTFWEGWSSPPLEAMASGIPVLASAIAPHRENLKDAAVLVPPEDVQGLAQEMERMLEDSSHAERYRSLGLEHVKKFTWEKMAQSTLRFYDEIIGRKG